MYSESDVDDLVAAATKLATVSLLAADVLSEQFDDLVRPSAEATQLVLTNFDPPKDWDGTLREEDIEARSIDRWDPSIGGNSPIGVELKHKPTGIIRQSASKIDKAKNHEIALKALREAVAARYLSQTK